MQVYKSNSKMSHTIPTSQFLKSLKTLTATDLIAIKGIGEVLADNFQNFLESSRYKLLLHKFEALELENKPVLIIIQNSITNSEKTLLGQIICITGSFEISRPEIKAQLEALGAKVTNTVSANTSILLAGENPGTKISKAEELGVSIATDLNSLLS